jgi:hypothetical protein
MAVGDRAEPYLVIAFARPDVMTTGPGQKLFQFAQISRHGGSEGGIRDLCQVLGHDMHGNFRQIRGGAVQCEEIRYGGEDFLFQAFEVSASTAKPSISLLVATQTDASSSHAARTMIETCFIRCSALTSKRRSSPQLMQTTICCLGASEKTIRDTHEPHAPHHLESAKRRFLGAAWANKPGKENGLCRQPRKRLR